MRGTAATCMAPAPPADAAGDAQNADTAVVLRSVFEGRGSVKARSFEEECWRSLLLIGRQEVFRTIPRFQRGSVKGCAPAPSNHIEGDLDAQFIAEPLVNPEPL